MGKAFGIEKYNGLLSGESYLREINHFPLLTLQEI
jgi:aspartyl-tRNA synthetase